MTNCEDPDQLASQKPTDLDLHCLQRQGIIKIQHEQINMSLDDRILFFCIFVLKTYIVV